MSLARSASSDPGVVIDVRIPRELKTPNVWNGRHWRYKHRETEAWEHDLFYAIAQHTGVRGVHGALLVLGAFSWQVCTEKRRVMVTRLMPSVRRFIRDEDNLRFCVKPLNDALKRLKLIRDDNRKWLDQPMPRQEVSRDGTCSTRIVIERVQP
jgi:Holliday junction resolvase RusA-like endonuclease